MDLPLVEQGMIYWLLAVGVLASVAAFRYRRFAADRRHYAERSAVASQYERENLRGRVTVTPEEFASRQAWHVLTTLGLPPLSVARRWLRSGKAEFVPPVWMLERYMRVRAQAPLPGGAPDARIADGEGAKLLELVRQHSDDADASGPPAFASGLQ